MKRLVRVGVVLWAALALTLPAAFGASAQDRNEALREQARESAREAGVRYPALTGRVVDAADILPADVEVRLTQKLAALEQRTTDQVVVATVPSLQGRDIVSYGVGLGRVWGVGQSAATQATNDRTGRDNGVILLVAPTERKVRIEVGYGLTPVLTDALSGLIVQNTILPKFREGDLPGGVEAGVDDIVEQLSLDRGVAVDRARQAELQAAQGGDDAEIPWWVVLLVVLFFVFFGRGWLPWFILGNLTGGGWRGGGGGGGFGGGGFGGGGGSFGGGGASGSW